MTLERITTQPNPYEPFLLSQGIRVGNLLFTAGQAGYASDGRIVEGGFRAQGEQAFSNLARVLVAGGSGLKSVVKVSIFLTDISSFGEIVKLRRKYFSEPYPADTIVKVSGLYTPEAVIEIEAVAMVTPRVMGRKIEGISLEQTTLKWGRGIAAFLTNDNQVAANKAMQQFGWNPQATLHPTCH